MNRRSFLVLATASCTVSLMGSLAGCSTPSTLAAEASSPAAAASDAALAAPPLTENSSASDAEAVQFPTRVEIPTIEVDTSVIKLGWSRKEHAGQVFSEWDVAEYAAGWHKNSAIPGAGGNVVLSGHNNIFGAVFRELDQLKKGDPITLWMDNRNYTYAVEQVIVLPDRGISDEQRVANAQWIGPFDEERLTLVSCWPRNNNTHRIVVIAHPQTTAQATQ